MARPSPRRVLIRVPGAARHYTVQAYPLSRSTAAILTLEARTIGEGPTRGGQTSVDCVNRFPDIGVYAAQRFRQNRPWLLGGDSSMTSGKFSQIVENDIVQIGEQEFMHNVIFRQRA